MRDSLVSDNFSFQTAFPNLLLDQKRDKTDCVVNDVAGETFILFL